MEETKMNKEGIAFIYLKEGAVKIVSPSDRFFNEEDYLKEGFVNTGRINLFDKVQYLFDKVQQDAEYGKRTLQSILSEIIAEGNQ